MIDLWRCVGGLAGVIAISIMNHAYAQTSFAPEHPASTDVLSAAAYKDYMLQCAGCHRYDGVGVNHRSVPSFPNSIGLLARLPAGRDYMIRVPGAAQSHLNDAELASVLNWIVATYGPQYVLKEFKPFTASEVASSRPYRFDNVVPIRQELSRALKEQGYELSTYTFGQNGTASD